MSRKIGKNCASVTASGFAFANMFAMSGNFNASLAAGYDSEGWPNAVTGSEVTQTQLFTDCHAPGGTYSIYGKGSGTFRIPSTFGGTVGTVDAQGRRVITVVDSGSGWKVDVTLSGPTYFTAILFQITASAADVRGHGQPPPGAEVHDPGPRPRPDLQSSLARHERAV
jgi:hypothetical protein